MLFRSTTNESWVLRYDATVNNWTVTGTVSGLQGTRLTGGVPYTTSTGVGITLTQPPAAIAGASVAVHARRASTDTNTQKTLNLNAINPSANGGRSKLTFPATTTLDLTGTAAAPSTITSAATLDLVINGGAIDASQFVIEQLAADGLQILSSSTATSFSDGTLRNNTASGTAMTVNNITVTGLAPWRNLSFDGSTTFDVRAQNNTSLVICDSTRGANSDDIDGTSSIHWCSAPEIIGIRSIQRTDGSKKSDMAIDVKDGNSDTVTVTTLEYSADNGTTWNSIAAPIASGTLATNPTSATLTGEWDIAQNLPATETNSLMIRGQVNDGLANSLMKEEGGIAIDTNDPRGLNFMRTTTVKPTSIAWEWSAEIGRASCRERV